jgi:acyl carrier protein
MIIQEQLQLIFRDVFKDPNLIINNEMNANQVNNWDSITHLVMISKVEETFKIKLKLKELIKLKNVGDLINLLNEKITV